jgi:hypothetical protein
MELKCVDLFAGIGAWELASSLVNLSSQIKLETIEFVENNPYCQTVLQTHWGNIPIHSDITDYIPKNKADVYLSRLNQVSGSRRSGALSSADQVLWLWNSLKPKNLVLVLMLKQI